MWYKTYYEEVSLRDIRLCTDFWQCMAELSLPDGRGEIPVLRHQDKNPYFLSCFHLPLANCDQRFLFFFSVSCFLCFTLNFLFPNIPLRSSAASLNCCQKLQYSLGVDAVGGAGISVETSSPRLVLISVSPWPVCTKSSHLYTPLNTAPGSDFNICTFVMGLFFFFFF